MESDVVRSAHVEATPRGWPRPAGGARPALADRPREPASPGRPASRDRPVQRVDWNDTRAAYVPLDPGFPRDRLTFTLADAALPMVLVDRASAGRLPPSGARLLRLEDLDGRPPRRRAPLPTACGDARAYVLYTSGSTGQPK